MENTAPAKRALATLDGPAPNATDTGYRISKRVRAAIGFLVSGECKQITEAAEKAGLARESLSRALDKPHVAAYMRQRVLKRLNMASAQAGVTKTDLLDSPNEMVRDRASSFVLALSGIAPESAPSVNINLEVKAGWVIDLREDEDPPPMRTIPHE